MKPIKASYLFPSNLNLAKLRDRYSQPLHLSKSTFYNVNHYNFCNRIFVFIYFANHPSLWKEQGSPKKPPL